MANMISLLASLVIILAIFTQKTNAVDYTVTNRAAKTPGGARFKRDIGAQYSKQTLAAATKFIWKMFQENTPADRKKVQKVSMFVDDMDGIAYTSNNEIHVSARYDSINKMTKLQLCHINLCAL